MEWLSRNLSVEEMQERLRDARVPPFDKTLLRQLLREHGVEPAG